MRAMARARPTGAQVGVIRPRLPPRPSVRAAAVSRPTPAAPAVAIDTDADADSLVVKVTGPNRQGLLTALTAAFRDLGLDVRKVNKWGNRVGGCAVCALGAMVGRLGTRVR